MHRRSAYPPGHPLRMAAEAAALEAVGSALSEEPEFAIVVSRNQLVIGGAGTDQNNPALSELAERLHHRGVGTITLRAGITTAEFERLLEKISEARARRDEDDDDADDDEPLPGAHVAVEMLSYDGLALADETDDDESGQDGTGDRLWRQLAEAALVGWDGVDGSGTVAGGFVADGEAEADFDRAFDALLESGGGDGAGDGAAGDGSGTGSGDGSGDDASDAASGRGGRGGVGTLGVDDVSPAMNPARMARAISAQARDGKSGTAVLKSLLRVARHARRRGRAGGGAVAARLREVLKNLEPGTMASLLASEVDPARKRLLILQGVDALPVSAVLDWIEAAAASTDRTISHHLLRLLKKVATQTRRRRDGGADDGGETLRQSARQLIEGWKLETRESEEHKSLLEHVAAYEGGADVAAESAAGAERLVQIALETDVVGSDVITAVDELIDAKRLGILLALLDRVEGSEIAATAMRAHLLSPAMLRHALLNEPVELDSAPLLLAACDAAHAESLLDVLSLSESQTTRQLVLQRLRELGDVIRDQVVGRLNSQDWYVVRNLLSLLGNMQTLPPRLAIDAYMRHDEPGVRVEALRLLTRMPERRETAVHDALLDEDERVVRAALDAAAAEGLPRRSGARLLQVAQKAREDSDLRARAIALLPQAPSAAIRDWLLKLVLRRRGMFFWSRMALQDVSSDVEAALRALAAAWRADPAAALALRLAEKSSDATLRDAVQSGARR